MSDLTLAASFARRELRGGLRGFRIFLACLALGVAAIAGVGSVSTAMLTGLRADARQLLGGDVDIRLIHRAAKPEQVEAFEEGGKVSAILSMRSMVRTADEAESSLVQLKGIDDPYPLVGALRLSTGEEIHQVLEARDGLFGAVAEEGLALRLGVGIGDKLKLGVAEFELRGFVEEEPDQVVNFANFGPRLMISNAALETTGLIQPGSLIRYHYRILLNESIDRADWIEALKERFPDAGWRLRSLENATPGYNNFVSRVTLFLSLVGLSALLVGGVGVAMAVKSYLAGRIATVATLKCLGASTSLIFKTYLLLVSILAFIGISIGLILGALAPIVAAEMINPLLAFDLAIGVYPAPLALAALFGYLTTLAFALWPLGQAQQVKAAELFRASAASLTGKPSIKIMIATLAVLTSLSLLAISTAFDPRFAIWFVVGSFAAFAIFIGAGMLVMRVAKSVRHPKQAELRLALANLHRPGAATPSVVLALGIGLTVLVTIALIQSNLTSQISDRLPEDAPSFFFIDVQPHQKEEFVQILSATDGVRAYQTTPMVRGRIVEIDGKPSDSVKIGPDSAWTLRGDRGITYAKAPPPGSKIVAGEWWAEDYSGPPLISFDERVAADYGVGLGDTLTLNILGRPITAEIANLREIDWATMGMNFMIIFSPGMLEAAPHSVLATVTLDGDATEASLQKQVTAKFPNVIGIRVRDALDAANQILETIGIAVRSTAIVTLLAGVFVLAGAIAAGQERRTQDAVVLKVLGATRARVLKTYLFEYGLLGLATALVASLVGSAIAYVVMTEVMRAKFYMAYEVVGMTALLATALTLALGFAGTWQALGRRPAGLLRNE